MTESLSIWTTLPGSMIVSGLTLELLWVMFVREPSLGESPLLEITSDAEMPTSVVTRDTESGSFACMTLIQAPPSGTFVFWMRRFRDCTISSTPQEGVLAEVVPSHCRW